MECYMLTQRGRKLHAAMAIREPVLLSARHLAVSSVCSFCSSNMATQTVPPSPPWQRARGLPPLYTHRALIARWCWTKICFFAAFYQRYSLFSLEWLQSKSASSFSWQLLRHAWALISLLFSWQHAPFSWYILCNTSFSLSPSWTLGHVCMS